MRASFSSGLRSAWMSLAGIVILFASSALCSPTVLRDIPYLLEEARMASGPDGSASIVWYEADPTFSGPGPLVMSVSSDSGWSSPITVTDGTTNPLAPAFIGVGRGGVTVVVWRQLGLGDVRQIAARKFVPGAGWGQIQLISAEGDYPSLSVAPHGEAQVVYFEGHTALARTLNPWLDTWSEPVALLQEIAYPTFPTLVSGDGYAFALINSDRGLEATIRQFGAARHLARYDHDGWRPATPVSDPSKVVVRSDFIASGENAAFVTREASFEFGGNQGEDTIEWLTGPPRRVVLPKNGCQLSMTPDNTVLAACEVQGEEVPGCFVGSRYGPYPVYYSYLESSLLRDDGTWTTPEIVTDVHRHIYFPRQFVDTSGNSYIASISNIPCQIDSSRVVARARAARRSSWQPEEIFDTFELKDLAVFSGGLPSFDAAVDPSGRLRAVWQKTSLDSSMDPPVHSTLLTSELQVLRPHPGRAKSWP